VVIQLKRAIFALDTSWTCQQHSSYTTLYPSVCLS